MHAARARNITVALWVALAASLLAWMSVGYSRILCTVAVLPLLAPLPGLLRGRRYTYAWATLFAVPYLMFALTELLTNPGARWVAGTSLILVFSWFCAMVVFLRASPAQPG